MQVFISSHTAWYLNVEYAKDVPETHHNQLPLDMFSLHMKEINRDREMIQGGVSDMTSEAMQGLSLVGLGVFLRQLLKSPAIFLDEDRTCKIL